jgi:hypothetical protein
LARSRANELGIAPRCNPVGDETAQTSPPPGEVSVTCINQRRQPKPCEQPSKWSGQPHLAEERDAPSCIAGYRCAITKNEPPTFATRVLGNGNEQLHRLLVSQREEGEFVSMIERGDDPRRPAAESSPACIEENRAAEGKRPG